MHAYGCFMLADLRAGCFECGITDQHVKGILSDADCLCSADVSAAKLPMEAMLAVAAYPALDVASAAYGFWSKLHQTLTSSTPAAMVGSAAILVYLTLPLCAIYDASTESAQQLNSMQKAVYCHHTAATMMISHHSVLPAKLSEIAYCMGRPMNSFHTI